MINLIFIPQILNPHPIYYKYEIEISFMRVVYVTRTMKLILNIFMLMEISSNFMMSLTSRLSLLRRLIIWWIETECVSSTEKQRRTRFLGRFLVWNSNPRVSYFCCSWPSLASVFVRSTIRKPIWSFETFNQFDLPP